MLNTHAHLHIRQLEGCLGFSRQAYYQYWQRHGQEINHEAQIIELVKKLREDHPKMGTRKLYDLLREQLLERGIKIGRDGLFEVLAANGLLIRRRRRTMLTTFSRHRLRKYPNLIKELVIDRPNQVWVSDITYWFTHYGCLYISLITDAYRSGAPVQAYHGVCGGTNLAGCSLQNGSTDGLGTLEGRG